MYHFCTYFDTNYLTRGLALHQSLKSHCELFKLWVLCLDDDTHAVLTKLDYPELQPISLRDFEFADERLREAKQNRSKVEYYFTCTPSLPLFILDHYAEVDLITYLDADLFFFADPAQLFSEMDGKSIVIVGHRFPARLCHLEVSGLYNVGWVSFRRDETGLECLRWWRDLCLEWCYDRIEADRYADQKYLNRFPDRFGKEIVLLHKGANVAPWNIENYLLTLRGETIFVDDEPLIFYHFQGLKQIVLWVYDLGFRSYGLRVKEKSIDYIYVPYIQTLQNLQSGKLGLRTIRSSTVRTDRTARVRRLISWWFAFFDGLARRQFSLVIKGKVISF